MRRPRQRVRRLPYCLNRGPYRRRDALGKRLRPFSAEQTVVSSPNRLPPASSVLNDEQFVEFRPSGVSTPRIAVPISTIGSFGLERLELLNVGCAV